MWESITFNARMEDAEAEPVKVVIYRREVIDIEVQQSPTFLYSTALLVVRAWARARAQRKQPHFCFNFWLNCHPFQDPKLIIFNTNPIKPYKIPKKR